MISKRTPSQLLFALVGIAILLSPFRSAASSPLKTNSTTDELKKEVLTILEVKCNSCHRRQNPFMIFKSGNIEKRADKIDKMVFVEKRMPKGDEVRLTENEYETLKKWLKTQNRK